MNDPLILTLQLDDRAQEFYEGLRQRYFPPERNVIAAHLTLFHNLPDDAFVEKTIADAARAGERFRLQHPSAQSIGRGVAVFFESAPLIALHAALVGSFDADLIPQDRQRFRPHIVVQNKVDPAVARETLEVVRGIVLMEPEGVGLSLWRYLGGPWECVGEFAFGASRAS